MYDLKNLVGVGTVATTSNILLKSDPNLRRQNEQGDGYHNSIFIPIPKSIICDTPFTKDSLNFTLCVQVFGLHECVLPEETEGIRSSETVVTASRKASYRC